MVTCESIRLLLDPPGTAISVLLHRRALPNARLIRAFGIRNSTFTNHSTGVRLAFRKHSMTRLRNLDTPETWQMLAEVIKGAVDFYLSEDHMLDDYATYMQIVVFVTVLAAFFNHDIPFPEATDVRFVTEGINTLWTDSKSPTFSSTSPVLVRINQYLHAWLPDTPGDPFHENPLEIILPAYETLWRLVAHAFTYIEGSPAYSHPFLDFLDNPTAMHFGKPGPLGAPSVQHLMQEVLRLHPPTKRIKRVKDKLSIPALIRRRLFTVVGFNCVSACCSDIVAADIEALQRSSVWGPSPHKFDPFRHRAPTEAQKDSFMPFGIGPLRCVASSLAPRLAGIIVGGMVDRGDIELIRGGSQGGREGWGGWKIRRKL
jgi:Cytochrome P450